MFCVVITEACYKSLMEMLLYVCYVIFKCINFFQLSSGSTNPLKIESFCSIINLIP